MVHTMTIPQSEAGSVSSEWQVFRTILTPELLNELQPHAPQCVYTPWVVTWLLVYQRLHGNASLSAAVDHFLTQFPAHARPDCAWCRDHMVSANPGAYSAARSDLEGRVVEVAAQRVFGTLVRAYPPSWRDRRAFILDGTTLALAPTKELTRTFPPASNQHGRSHWPVMHLVVAHELASGLAAAPQYGAMYGPNAVGEVDLAVRLLGALPDRSVLLADRNFGVFGFVHGATGAGHDVVVRLTESRFRALVKKGTWVDEGRWSLIWEPSPADRKTHTQLPPDATVRGWVHEVRVRPDLTLWLLSTVDATGAELATLYGQRARVETDIRDLKVALKLDQLRGQSESMVVKELWAARVAYNLTTQVRRLAAARIGVEPRRLSFAGVWSLVRAFVPMLHVDQTEAQRQAVFEQLLRACGQRKLPTRKPGRSYPREVIARRRKFPERKRVKPPTT
jgi:hypothetical protein